MLQKKREEERDPSDEEEEQEGSDDTDTEEADTCSHHEAGQFLPMELQQAVDARLEVVHSSLL